MRATTDHQSPGGWWQYDSRSAEQLERAHRDGSDDTELLLCGSLYTVRLRGAQMVQTSRARPERRRLVKREHVAVQRAKGVAGLLRRDARRQ